MSLVNDALKRARAAQDQAPVASAPAPKFRPVDGAAKSAASKFVPVILVVLAGAVVALGWQVMKKQGSLSSDTTVQARSKPTSVTVVAAPPLAPPPVSAPSTQAVTRSLPAAPMATTVAAVAAAPPATAASAVEPGIDEEALLQRPPGAVTPAEQTAVAEPAAPPTPPAPAPLRLQSIFAHPTRPSAMISGKVLFVGERVRNYQLKSIKGSSVNLEGPEGTIVLTLR